MCELTARDTVCPDTDRRGALHLNHAITGPSPILLLLNPTCLALSSAFAFASSASASAGAPVNTAPPVLSGPAEPGWPQTGTQGTWTGSPTLTFAYQWSDCDVAAANCTSIAGANLSSYWPGVSDFGYTLELTVTATNSRGAASATSALSNLVTLPP